MEPFEEVICLLAGIAHASHFLVDQSEKVFDVGSDIFGDLHVFADGSIPK